MRKLRKLFHQPGPFVRDFLLKRRLVGFGRGYNIPSSIPKLVDAYKLDSPVDIVYTWVSSRDKQWNEKRRNYELHDGIYHEHGLSPLRFEDHDELKYSLRSIEAYAPWVRNIYIVSDGAMPSWLNINHPKIHIVPHSEIIDRQYLPCFNSHVIEAHLQNIPGLAEYYIYFNDDVFLTRPVSASYFFLPNGIYNVFIDLDKEIVNLPSSAKLTPTYFAVQNACKLLENKFSRTPRYYCAHTFFPQVKSIAKRVYDLFNDEIAVMCNNKFRAPGDLPLASFLNHYYAYFSGCANLTSTEYFYFNIRSFSSCLKYTELLSLKESPLAPYSMCLNDFYDADITYSGWELNFKSFLDSYYPSCSSFETC